MVNIKTIDAKVLSRMFLAGAKNLEAKKEWINELNVFPVPDGDTGTNMTMTIMSAAAEVSALTEPDMETLAKAISSGSLRGARGNSGVILSQLLRGFTRGVRKSNELDAITIAAAMERAVETAYKAVMKPKEGTILTVAKEAALKAAEIAPEAEELEPFFKEIFEHAEYTLSRTPEMLPVLKEAGVVDSGGQGLVEFLQGAVDALMGKEVDLSSVEKPAVKPAATASEAPLEEKDIKFGYCTEFIVKEAEVKEDVVRSTLQPLGNSLIVAVVGDIVKVHIHTKAPGLVLQHGLSWGSLHDIKIDNMAEQHQHRVVGAQTEKHGLAVLSVAAGNGIASIMHQLGAVEIISGGQSMNPPVEAFIKVIEKGSAEQYIILPNNKNIILAAEQVKKLLGAAQVDYVPTTNLAQGLAALLHFDAAKTLQENSAVMRREAKEAHSAAVSIAVRDSVVNGITVKKGQYIGLIA